MNRCLRVLLVCGIAAATALVGMSAAQAAPHRAGPASCSGTGFTDPGILASGTYHGLTVSGFCLVPDGVDVTVRGNVTITPGSTLFAITTQSMRVTGNITVGSGAILALGCGPGVGCDGVGDDPAPSTDVVHGAIKATDALAMYLNGDTVYGNVTFRGGGWGRDCTDPDADAANDPLGHDLVVKDNTFHGTVTLDGWAGCWMGFIRNTVHGTVSITNNYANPDNIVNPNSESPEYQGLDSTEVTSNHIWGRLACSGNTPAAQFGDSGGGPNTVHGKVSGECVAVTN